MDTKVVSKFSYAQSWRSQIAANPLVEQHGEAQRRFWLKANVVAINPETGEPAGVVCQIIMPVRQAGCAMSGPSWRVLLVEDEMLVVWLLEDMLTDLGCAVVGPASSVKQALAIIDVEALDAAVLDVNSNGQMSYPIADALTARGVPFAFSTGYDKDTLLDDYRSFPVLQKPFHRAELSDTLANLLTPKTSRVESVPAVITESSP